MRRKQWVGWSIAFAASILLFGLLNPAALQSAGYSITEAILTTKTRLFSARQDFGAGINTRTNINAQDGGSVSGPGTIPMIQHVVDGTIQDPTSAPIITGQTGSSGCTNGTTYQVYAVFYGPTGLTLISPASNQFTVSGSNANLVVTEPTPPAGANSYRLWWGRNTDGYASKKSCTIGGGSFIPIGTTSSNCGCSAGGLAPPSSNTTTAAAVQSFLNGTIKTATYLSTLPYTMTPDRTILSLSGAIPTWSPDAGTTTAALLSAGPRIKAVCSTCEFTTVAAAIAAVTGQSVSNPFVVLVYPGLWNEDVTLGSYTTLMGASRSGTIVKKIRTADGAQEVAISNLTVADAIWTGNNRATPTNLYITNVNAGSFDDMAEYGIDATPVFTGSTDFVNGTSAAASGGGNTIRVWGANYHGTWDAYALGVDETLIQYGSSLDLRGTAETSAARCFTGLTGFLRVIDRGSTCSVSMSGSSYGTFGYAAASEIDNTKSISGAGPTLTSLIDLANTRINVSTTNASLTGSHRSGVVLIEDVVAAGGAGAVKLTDVDAVVSAADASQTIDGLHFNADAQLTGWTGLWDRGSLVLSGGATRNDVASDEASVSSITLRRLANSGLYSGAGTAVSLGDASDQAGSCTFAAATTCAVTLPFASAVSTYKATLGCSANKTFWITNKGTTGFTINASSSSSDTCDWRITR